ncbi:MAG: polysaccharide deacetylase family protein [Pseudomonadota bacterium]
MIPDTSSTDFHRFESEFVRHLDWFAERGRKVSFWWRDDDAIEPSPALDRMLALANEHDVDLALAVIPKDATGALARRLADEPGAFVLQHGWQHKNFQLKEKGEKAAELGSRRDPDELIDQLKAGKARLETLFGDRFIPAIVPPWNRIAPEISRRLPGIGLPGLSTFTFHNFPRDHQIQSHIDILKWKKPVRFIGWESARLRFDLQLTRRRNTRSEPVGLLSHHLAHDEASFEFLEKFLSIAAHHEGAEWPRVKDLFG